MLKKDLSLTFITTIISLFLGMLSSIIIARVLGPGDRGLFGLALLIPTTIATFCIFGQGIVNTVYAGLEKDSRTQLLWQALFYSVVAGAVSFAIIYIYFRLPIERGLFNNLSQTIILISCFYAPAEILNMLIISLVRGIGKIKTASILSVINRIFLLSLIFIFLIVFKKGLYTLLLIHITSFLFVVLMSLWILRKYISLNFRTFSLAFFKRTFAFGFWVNLTTVATFLLYKIDQGILGYMVTAQQVGFYIVAVNLAEQLRVVPNSISTAYVPRLANEKEARQRQVPKIFRYTTIISVMSMVLIGIFGIPGIYILYGKEYAGSIVPFLLLLPGVAALGGASILSGYLSVREKPKYGVLISVCSLTLNVILNFLLIPYLGIAGAALASTICYINSLVLVILFYLHESKEKSADLLPKVTDFVFLYDQSKSAVRQIALRYLPAMR